jgi:hypothetical protein
MDYSTVAPLILQSQKKAILARHLLHQQVRKPKFLEHQRNDVLMHQLEKSKEKDGFFVERYR